MSHSFHIETSIQNKLFSSLHFCPKAFLGQCHQHVLYPAPPLFSRPPCVTATTAEVWNGANSLPGSISAPCQWERMWLGSTCKIPAGGFVWFLGTWHHYVSRMYFTEGCSHQWNAHVFLLTSSQGPEPFPKVGSEVFLLQDLHFLTTRSLDQAHCWGR